MLNGNYHVEKKNLVIDLAEIDGVYEAMAMKRGGLEVESFRSRDFMEAVDQFLKLVDKYAPAQPLEIPEKKTRKTSKKEPVNKYGVKVGDLFYDSWGYEQTNIDFYQVVALKGTTQVILKAIRADARNVGFCSDMVKPRKDDFITGDYITRLQHSPEGITRTIKAFDLFGTRHITAGSGRESLSLTDWGTEHNQTSYY